MGTPQGFKEIPDEWMEESSQLRDGLVTGGFHKWWYRNSWMVYSGKTIYKWMI
jgi:hypothetical protein